MNHFATPWKAGGLRILDADGRLVVNFMPPTMTREQARKWDASVPRAYAEYIVRCVNSHDELVAACNAYPALVAACKRALGVLDDLMAYDLIRQHLRDALEAAGENGEAQAMSDPLPLLDGTIREN